MVGIGFDGLFDFFINKKLRAVIFDFEDGVDTIQFASAGVSTFGDLELLDVSSGARIDYGSGFVIVSATVASDLDGNLRAVKKGKA